MSLELVLRVIHLIGVSILSLGPLFAGDHAHAHVHGQAHLSVVAENSVLQIEFVIPTHDALGFEHSPKSEAQKQTLNKAKVLMQTPNQVFLLPEAAGCAIVEKELNGGELKKDSHHSEFRLVYKYKCKSIKNLKQIKVVAYSGLKHLENVKAVAIFDEASFKQALTRQNAVFTF